MRDPNRIPTLLDALTKVWYQNPDLRLGQLIINASGVKCPQLDPFYCEDDQMLEGLERLTK